MCSYEPPCKSTVGLHVLIWRKKLKSNLNYYVMLFKFSYILLNHLERETQNIIYLWIIWRETKKHIIYWLIIWRETCLFDTLTQTQTYLTVISVSAFFSVSDNFPSVPKPLSLYEGGRPLVAVYKAPEEGQGCHFPEGQSDSQPAASTPLRYHAFWVIRFALRTHS